MKNNLNQFVSRSEMTMAPTSPGKSDILTSEFNPNEARITTPAGFIDQPVAAGNVNPPQMEWGRWRDVQSSYGVKRGLLHLLCSEGKIRSVVIKRRGNIHGTRYYLMSSVSAYLHSLLAAQEKKSA